MERESQSNSHNAVHRLLSNYVGNVQHTFTEQSAISARLGRDQKLILNITFGLLCVFALTVSIINILSTQSPIWVFSLIPSVIGTYMCQSSIQKIGYFKDL